MPRLSIEELVDLERTIMSELKDKMLEILTLANRTDRIDELLESLGLSHILDTGAISAKKDGKIVVIGDSSVKEKELLGIAKQLGLCKNRFELCLDYEKTKTYQYQKFNAEDKYTAILFGATPHKSSGSGDDSSVIVALEKKHNEGIVPAKVIRLMANNAIKITKSNFKIALQELIECNAIAVDMCI